MVAIKNDTHKFTRDIHNRATRISTDDVCGRKKVQWCRQQVRIGQCISSRLPRFRQIKRHSTLFLIHLRKKIAGRCPWPQLTRPPCNTLHLSVRQSQCKCGIGSKRCRSCPKPESCEFSMCLLFNFCIFFNDIAKAARFIINLLRKCDHRIVT